MDPSEFSLAWPRRKIESISGEAEELGCMGDILGGMPRACHKWSLTCCSDRSGCTSQSLHEISTCNE